MLPICVRTGRSQGCCLSGATLIFWKEVWTKLWFQDGAKAGPVGPEGKTAGSPGSSDDETGCSGVNEQDLHHENSSENITCFFKSTNLKCMNTPNIQYVQQ